MIYRQRRRRQDARATPAPNCACGRKVQGAALVLENKTGRILAMVGGFSYPLSQLNRTTQALRQPGSSIKPLTYLAALHRGPAAQHAGAGRCRSRCRRSPASPPITGRRRTTTARAAGTMTLRRALENSKNLVTARLLDGGIDKDPTKSLELICDLALEAKIYPECMKNYPFVLGAQALRMIDLAAFYAAIANEGARVTPYAIDSIEQNGQPVYRHQRRRAGDAGRRRPRRVLPAAHHARRRGGARHRGLDEAPDRITSAARPAPPTTRTTPGSSASPATSPSRSGSATTTPAASARSATASTGGQVAVPIVEPIIQATWNFHAPKTPLPPPSAEAARHLKALPIDLNSGQKARRPRTSAFTGIFPARRPQEAARHPATRWSTAAHARGAERAAPGAAANDEPDAAAAVHAQQRPAAAGAAAANPAGAVRALT